MADELIVKYRADIEGYKAELDDLKKADKTTRDTVEKPIEITADTKSLKSQLRAAQAEVAVLSEKFGATSKEAANAAKKAAQLKDAIADAKNLTDAFNPDAKFAALSSSIGGVVGGFQAYEGALVLVGAESEDLQKTLVKLQGIMALSQGLQQLGEAKDSFKQLGAVIKDQVTGAFTSLKGAMAALGIGVLVIALGLIIANWEQLVAWIDKTFPGLKKVTDFFKNFQQVSAGAIDAVVAGFRRLGSVVGNFFSGNFSAAMADAKKVGSDMAFAYNQGYAEKDAELKKQQAIKDRKFQLDLAEAQGKDVKAGRIKLAKDELSLLKENSDKYREKQIEIAKLQKEAQDDAIKKREEQLKKAQEKEKEYNEKVFKDRDAALKKISDLEVTAQKALIAEMESMGEPSSKVEKEKIKLLELEQKYNNQILAIRTSYANQLQSKYSDTKEKELQAIKDGNKVILDEEARIRNERRKAEIQDAISGPDSKTAGLEKLKKQLQNETTLTLEEANKRKIELLKIEEEIILSKMQNNDKQIQALLQAEASYDSELVQSRLKSNEELNAALIVANKAKLDEQQKQEEDAARKRAELLKAQIDNLFAFAQNGLLIKLGLDPNSVALFKSQVESAASFLKQANKEGASDDDKKKARQSAALEATKAAATAVIAGVDMITASEKAASEEKIAQLNVEKDAELAAAEGNAEKQDIIRQKYDQKIKAEKRKQFEADKRASIIKAIIGTALAVVQASPNPILMALAAAVGAAQIALIASQPTPKFKDGGMVGKPISDGLLSGKPHSAGGILLEAEGGEYIINKKSTQNNLPLIEAINDGSINDMLNKHYIMPAIENAEKNAMQRNEKRISDIQTLIVNKAINQTLKSIERKGDINTSRIVEAVKGDKFTL